MPETSERPAGTGAGQAAADVPRIGVYLCHCGGNIGDTVRGRQVMDELTGLPNVTVARDHMFMCSDPGQQLIADDVKEQGINRVVVGACSIFLHEQTFRRTVERAGLNPYLYYHIGLREQDSWVHHSCPAEATAKAIRMLSAGIARARLMRPLQAVELPAEGHALVIGGGVAGLRAALSIARRNLRVTLVEKSHFLGGHLAQWEHVFPTDEAARSLLHGLIQEVLAEPGITIHTGAEVIAARGYVGNFELRIRQQPRGVAGDFAAIDEAIAACPVEVPDEFNFGLNRRKAIYLPYAGCYPSGPVIDWQHCTRCQLCLQTAQNGGIRLDAQAVEFELKAGAVVIATGFRPYEPFPGELGYGTFPEVITLPQLERLLAAEGPTRGDLAWAGRPVAGGPVRSIAMIHCVGSRQVEGVHEPQPDGAVNDYCSRVCCTATLAAANRMRERWPQVNVYDVYQDIRTYGRGHEDYYRRASANRVTFLRYLAEAGPQVVAAEEGAGYPLLVRVQDHLTWGEEIELPVDLVVLAVGMMPSPVQDLVDLFKVAPGNDRFLLEVHPKLRPVETAVPGVVLAGTAQGPMNIQESCAGAEAAASKVAILLGQGTVELEPYVAVVDPERCQGTGECVRVCPQEGALHLEPCAENGGACRLAVVTPANCNGCGVCVSACPNRAIDVQGWRLEEFEAMVEAIGAPVPELEGAL
jgi:heterodisulfide reductase subunit A2